MQKYLVEFIGTFFLVLTIGLAVLEPGSAGNLAPVAIGLMLTVMVYAGGHVSGAHYNPAVTLAVFMRGKCPAKDVAPYMIAQCVAAAAAAGAVLYFKSGATIVPLSPKPAPAMLAEFLFTFALVYVVLNVATAKATAGNSYYGVAIGCAVLAGAYVVGPISGAMFNPAVAIGACVLGVREWTDIWMYLVADFAGGVAAAVAFKALVKDPG